MKNHPRQPVVMVDGVARFKKNNIVRYLLDSATEGRKVDLNDIALMLGCGKNGFTKDDYTQLMQLIGYSVSGAGDLEDFDRRVLYRADQAVEKMRKNDE